MRSHFALGPRGVESLPKSGRSAYGREGFRAIREGIIRHREMLECLEAAVVKFV